MNTPFHQELATNISENNILGANRVIMGELGNVVVNHRQDFVDLLVNSDAPAFAELADKELVDMYFENLHKKDLIIGTALLVNIHNKTEGADGESEINDVGVKAAYKVMNSCFSGQVGPITPQEIAAHRYDWEHSNIFGSNIIKAGIKGAKLLKNLKANQNASQSQNVSQNKSVAKANVMQSIATQRKMQSDIAQAKKDRNLMIGLAVGGGVVLVAIIGLLIYKLKK